MSVSKFRDAKRIIVKVGGSQLINGLRGGLNQTWIDSLVSDIVELKKEGKQVIIVSSGAILLAVRSMMIDLNKAKLTDKQALSCIGQVELMTKYAEAFQKHGVHVSQVLLTIEDIENRKRFLSARTVFDYLLDLGVVPIVNENDALATAEIRFGDNDRLAGRVSQIANADMLILFSNIDAMYTANPQVENNAKKVKVVYEINSDVEKMAGDAPDSSGGMSAKVVAAKIAMKNGCKVAVVDGRKSNPIRSLIADEDNATWFYNDASSKVKYIF